MDNLMITTEEQRQGLIADCKISISNLKEALRCAEINGWKQAAAESMSSLLRQQIALAALTAEPVAYSYLCAAYETCDGFTGWSHEFSLEPPPQWMLETGKVKNLRKLYTTPPAPVMKLPEYASNMDAEYDTEIAHNVGWNACIDNIKRLNGGAE